MPKTQSRGFSYWLKHSVWVFPAFLLILLVLLTIFRISGSSVGTYHNVLYGAQQKDPDLLYGKPRAVRSDEWLAATQLVVSQTKTGFHSFNSNINTGRDLAIQPEVPNTDWSTAFRPQNWSYFVLPLEYAFAFKWWLILFLLVVACYFFALRVLNGRRTLSILLSVAFGLSPFLLWWYQSAAFLPLAFGILMLILCIRIIDREDIPLVKHSRLRDSLYVAALAFLATCFGLILYPPFQIPVALVMAAFLVGYSLQKIINDKQSGKDLLLRLSLVLVSGVITGLFVGLFIIGHQQMIHSLTSTLYPGKRIIYSGDLKLLSVFDAHLQPLLQSDARGNSFIGNQSEASNFILMLPYLLIPGFVLLYHRFKKTKAVDWVLLCLQLIGVLFLVRAYIPIGSILYKPLLLDRVPNTRLLIGMGLVGMLQLLYFIRGLDLTKIRRSKLMPWAFSYGLSCLLVMLWAGSYVIQRYPHFLHSYLILISFSLLFVSIIVSFMARRPLLGAGLLLLFTVGSTFRILPLQRGLGVVSHSSIVQEMERVSPPGSKWATVDDIYFENFGLLAGRGSITGVQLYPDLKLWQQIGGDKNEIIYNREAHALFTTNPNFNSDIKLIQNNLFFIKLQCSPFVKNNVDFVLALHAVDIPCIKPVGTVNYPAKTFYLYKISR